MGLRSKGFNLTVVTLLTESCRQDLRKHLTLLVEARRTFVVVLFVHCSVASAVKHVIFGGSRLSVKLFHRPFGVIINPVGLAGQKSTCGFSICFR